MHYLRLLTGAAFFCGCICLMSGCDDKGNPANVPPDDPNRDTLFYDSFESAISSPPYIGYMLNSTDPAIPYWSLSSHYFHSGKSSVKSDSNTTGMEKFFDEGIDSGVVGCEFYIMAGKAEQTNFEIFFGTSGGSAGGRTAWIGMGFDKSDSVKCTFFDGIPIAQDYKTVAKIAAGHWYKCRVEYSFATHMAGFFLDNVKVGEIELVNIFQFNMVVAYRDASGSQGPKDYYLDDLLCYKLK